MAQPLGECTVVACQPQRLDLGLPREIQLDSKFIVRGTLFRATDPGIQLLSA